MVCHEYRNELYFTVWDVRCNMTTGYNAPLAINFRRFFILQSAISCDI